MSDYDEYPERFTKARMAVIDALKDAKLTAGAKIEWHHGMLIAGNLAIDDPELSPLYIDGLGRVWKERHVNGEHSLECVFDLRRAWSAANPQTRAA